MAGRLLQFDYRKALDAAMGVFWEKGYEASSVQDLLDAMEIPKGSLYNTFKSKEELYSRALQHYRSTVASALLKELDREGSRIEAVRHFFDIVIDVACSDGAKGCLMVSAALEHSMRRNGFYELATETFTLIEKALRNELSTAKKKGELRQDIDPTAAARYLMSLFYGIRIQGAMGTTKAQLRKMVTLALSDTLVSSNENS